MYYLIVVLCWTASVIAAPAPSDDVLPLEKQQPTVIPIVSQSEELEPNGTYKFSYETGNGIKREELSYDKILPKSESRSADSNEGGESSSESDEIHVQQGSYSYTAPDGTLISVRYIADENGFQPIGDHIPKVLSASQSSPSSSNSGKKSGRALKKPVDNAEAGSGPEAVVAGKPELRSALVSAPEPKPEEPKSAESGAEATETPAEVSSPGAEPATASPKSSAAAVEVSTEAAKSTEAPAKSTTEDVAPAGSTTEGAKESESATETSASAVTSESSSPPLEASTTA